MSQWFKQYRRCGRPAVRLFCFPYAGGSAAVFEHWHRRLPANVDVFAVQAPGRGSRFAEPPIADLAEKVARLHTAIEPFVDVAYVFVGHSTGALTAFELARSLQAAGSANLRHLVISAKRAPHLPKKIILHRLPDDELIRELRAYDATPAAILDSQELMELFLPMLRADFALSETGEIGRLPRLRGQCTLFHGRHDRHVDKPDLLAWRDYLDGPLGFREFDGDHFFIDNRREEFIDAMRDILIDSTNTNPVRPR